MKLFQTVLGHCMRKVGRENWKEKSVEPHE